MEKQRFTVDDVASDMRTVIRDRRRAFYSWRIKFIAPSALFLHVLLLVLTEFTPSIGHKLVIAVLVLTIAYNLVMLVVQLLGTRKIQRAIDKGLMRGDINVSIEKFSHVTTEEIYEPYFSGRWIGLSKTIRMYYFSSGAGWREPVTKSHYAWSLICETSSQGLENTAIAGDEFYLITLCADRSVKYIYNTKLFEFKE